MSDYDFPEEDYFTECKVVGFESKGMKVKVDDGSVITVQDVDGQKKWNELYTVGDGLETYLDSASNHTYYRKKE